MKEKQEKAATPQYNGGVDSAPTAAATGGGLVAEKIISLARKNGVPVHGDRNLVEILSTIDFYEEIPTDLYKAAAEIISFIHRVSGRL